jgi:hypothetical protein
MQERLWKMAAAAQVSRWVAQETGNGDVFWARDLYQKQRKNAHTMAAAVMKFWQAVETLSCRDDVAPLQQGSSPLVSQKEPNDDKAVRREVNESNTIKVAYAMHISSQSHIPLAPSQQSLDFSFLCRYIIYYQ